MIYSGVNGYTDEVAVGDVVRFERQFLDTIRDKGSDILTTIRTEKALSEETEGKLKAFLDDFVKTFA